MSRQKKIVVVAIATLCAPVVALLVAFIGFEIWASGAKISEELLPTATALPAFYDSEGAQILDKNDRYIAEDELFDDLVNAFVAVEDKRFFKHKGYDPIRIGGAILKNLKSGAVKEGASTITQQLVKNTHLTVERTLKRKLNEIAIAKKLEKRYSKRQILSMYLSVIYFGSGAYGVKNAARIFFDKSVDELTLDECALLAGLVKNPAGYSPVAHVDSARKRRDVVLSLMREQGLISKEECEAAMSAPINVKTSQNSNQVDFSLYLSLAKKEAINILGMTEYQFDNSGVKVFLNLDRALQTTLEKERKDRENFESEDIASVAAVIDNASGAVLAYSSTYPYTVSRQTGSVLKPLAVYAPALNENVVSLATPIVDERIDFAGFSPSNFNDVYYGETTVREGVKKSMNSVSVKVLDYLGVERSVEYLKKFGIAVSDKDKNYSLALGANATSPLNIAAAYGAIARGGEYVEPSFVKYILSDGKKESCYANNAQRTLSKSSAYLMTLALKDAVRDGTARSLSTLPFEVAAKTGTVEMSGGKNSDGWCASYNSDFTVVVWHGSDDGMTERGGGYPTLHARKVWQALDKQKALTYAFAPCDDVTCVEIDTYSTRNNKKVVAASKNTPSEYRKFEFFASNALPSASDSLFESVPQKSLDVKLFEGHIELYFEPESIYRYKLFRTDILGRALIYACDGDGAPSVLRDTPISFGSPVEYELVVELKSNPDVYASSKKSVYFEM